MKKITRGIPVIFGYDHSDVLGRAEIVIHDDDSSTITINCPPSAKTLPEILEEIPVVLCFVYVPQPREDI